MSGWKHPTVSPRPILIYMIVCAVIFRTYPHPCDALQLCLGQVCNYDRGGSRSSKDHLVMRCLFCSCVLYEHTLPLLTLKWYITNKWSEEVKEATDIRAGVHSVNPFWRSSQFRVPAHHYSNHVAFCLQHHLSDPQKHIRGTRAARRLGCCCDKDREEITELTWHAWIRSVFNEKPRSDFLLCLSRKLCSCQAIKLKSHDNF